LAAKSNSSEARGDAGPNTLACGIVGNSVKVPEDKVDSFRATLAGSARVVSAIAARAKATIFRANGTFLMYQSSIARHGPADSTKHCPGTPTAELRRCTNTSLSNACVILSGAADASVTAHASGANTEVESLCRWNTWGASRKCVLSRHTAEVEVVVGRR
jgi:hypothetical protein